MIYIYSTEGYVPWAKLFLKSYKLFNNENEKIFLAGWNLSDKSIHLLKQLYDNLIIENDTSTIKELSKRYNISKYDILKSQKNCESDKKIGGQHRLWMNIHADGLRIERFYKVLKSYPMEKYFLFLDVDVLFRKNIQPWIDKMKISDVCIKMRMGKHLPNNEINKIILNLDNIKGDKINISTVFINNNECGHLHVKNWVNSVNSISMEKRTKTGSKWGQYAAEVAFMKSKSSVIYHRHDVYFSDPTWQEDSPIWFFKKKNKKITYEIANNEFNKLKNRRDN